MAERDQGPSAEPPARDEALEARVTAHLVDLPPADDLTRRRHLQAALTAFDALHGGVGASGTPAGRGRRTQRILGAVAAAAVVMIGLGVVASIARPAPEMDLMRAATSAEEVTAAVAEESPAASAGEAPTTYVLAPADDSQNTELLLAEAAGPCRDLVEEEFDRQARARGLIRDPSQRVILTPVEGAEGSAATPVRITDPNGLEVLLDRETCTLLTP